MAFLASFALTAFFGIFGLYALQKYNAGPEVVGSIMMVFGLVTAVAQGLLTGPLTKRWGEVALIQGTLISAAAGFLAISLAGTLTTFLLAIGWFTLATTLLATAVSALTSRRTTLEQGVTMGLSNATQSLGRIVGPLLGGIAFDLQVEYPNHLGAAVMGAGFLMSLLLSKEHRAIKDTQPDSRRSS
jgi:DHA1 family multidrug resistance protein-like MFS transporter